MIPRRLLLKWKCVIWEEGTGPCLLLSLWSRMPWQHPLCKAESLVPSMEGQDKAAIVGMKRKGCSKDLGPREGKGFNKTDVRDPQHPAGNRNGLWRGQQGAKGLPSRLVGTGDSTFLDRTAAPGCSGRM